MAPAPNRAIVDGDVATGYGPVADEFRRNFTERNELGAAVAVVRDGKPVVDLWVATATASAPDRGNATRS